MEKKKEFLKQFEQILSRRKRPIEDIFSTMEQLYSIDKKEAVRLAFAAISYAREGITYKRSGGRKVVVDVMGLRNVYEGTGMVYWLMKYQPKMFYSNLYQLGVLFGGWKELITVWELDLKLNNMNLENCCISQCKMYDILMRAILDKDYGPEAVKAMPNIRRSRHSNTMHRKCRNIIGKYIRSRMPKSNSTTQNKYYKLVKRTYKGIKVRYKRLNMDWMKEHSLEEDYNTVMNQAALKYINFKCIDK